MTILEMLKRAFVTRLCILCYEEAVDYNRKYPICDDCIKYWINHSDLLCPKCGYDAEYCTCTKGRNLNKTDMLIFATFYQSGSNNPINKIVYRLKRDYNREVFLFCAEVMKEKTVKIFKKHNMSYDDYVVTFAPRRKDSIIRYGYDHSEEIAKYFAQKLGLKEFKTLKNIGKKEQKQLDKVRRLENAKKSYEFISSADVKNKKVFLIDDVITSGSTINVCANILKENGASIVIPVCYAKDI